MNQWEPAADTGYSLVSKILLALASIASYVLVLRVAEAIEPLEGIPDPGTWFPYAAGATFGAFVLMPYVGANRRALRIAGLCVASALVYRLAVRFAIDGPLEASMLATFAITGAGAAVLCALAVVLIASRPASAPAFAYALVAGALGGASLDHKVAADPDMLIGHGIWQVLVCLALHAAFERRIAG